MSSAGYALRHLPVLMLTSLAYLTGETDVKIRGVYHGAYEARIEGRTPIFNLTPFLTLTDCYHAIHQYRETGDARRLVQCLKDTNAQLWRHGEGSRDLSTFTNPLERLSAGLVAALPLEIGSQSRHALGHLAPALEHVALVDARPYAEQKENPYVHGELVVLDSVTGR